MIKYLQSFFRCLVLDPAIFYSSLSKIIAGFGGFLTVFLIARNLNSVEQGYYYTFISVVYIQVFFELGFSSIITQFVAHEKAYLKWKSKKELVGELNHLSRLSSIFRFCFKWYSQFSILLFVALFFFGYIFFKYAGGESVSWFFPWLLLCIATSLSFFVNPFLSFLEGLNLVNEVYFIRFIQQIIILPVMWAGLLGGIKLYVGGFSSLCGGIVVFVYIVWKYKVLFHSIFRQIGDERISYRKEIFPFQWRVALGWLSGSLVFQFFNPVLFATVGSIAAGQLGMTLSIINGISSVSMNWIYTKIPKLSNYVSLKDFTNLDRLFNKSILAVIVLSCLGYIGMAVILIQFDILHIAYKLLPLHFFALMAFSSIFTQITSGWAIYYRCFKKEVFFHISLISVVLIFLIVFPSTYFYKLEGLILSYFAVSLIIFILGKRLFDNKGNFQKKYACQGKL